MRKIAKKIILWLWLGGALVVGTVFRQNIEEASARRGLDRILGEGLGVVTASGYESLLLWSFAILTGMLIAVWGEWLLRKWEGRKRLQNWAHIIFTIEGDQHSADKRCGVDTATALDGQVLGNLYKSDPKLSRNVLSIIIQFNCEIEAPCPYVFADRKVIWREVRSSSRYLMLEIDRLSKDDVAFGIIARPVAWQGGWSGDTALKWHDATVLPREAVLATNQAANPSRQWLRGIAAGMRR